VYLFRFLECKFFSSLNNYVNYFCDCLQYIFSKDFRIVLFGIQLKLKLFLENTIQFLFKFTRITKFYDTLSNLSKLDIVNIKILYKENMFLNEVLKSKKTKYIPKDDLTQT
jgi:hypothetical protein